VVSTRLDRVGIRLDGHRSAHTVELPSEPACVGCIQITPDGTPIILGPDGPTIGGYPKAAVVISADLDRLGQLRPGQNVEFEAVSLDEARRLYREYREGSLRAVAALNV
jgi:allophanate hydrolase subunit 2